MAVSVAVDQVMKVGSLKKLGDRGNELVDFIAQADKLERNPAVKKYLKIMGRELLGIQLSKKYTKAMIAEVIEAIANEARGKNVPPDRPPVFIMPPWGPDPNPDGPHFM
jgi:hypothetical protein